MDNTALYKLGYGLYVLSSKNGEKDNGCIINTMIQVTQNPLKAVIAVNKQNLTHDMIMETRKFNISVLTNEAPFELYKHFGFQSGKSTDKIIGYDNIARSDNGLIYIPKFTNAYLSLNVDDKKDLGTHTLFFANIVNAEKLSDVESVTYSYYQKNVKPKADAPKKGKTIWRCKICGYEYEGDELPPDFICPICKHGASDFEKIEG
jgi:flavin reductase (DIM6/NTAB) family NADH-FMN oxidoreductase RutF